MLLTKGLGLPKLDSNSKRLDTGYIASIYSANYNTAIRRAQHRTKIEKDDLLLLHRETSAGGSAQKRTSKFADVRNRRRASSDTTLIQPLPSIDKRESLTSHNGADADLESINSLEFTKDLGQEQSFLKVGSPSKTLPIGGPFIDSPEQSSQAKAPHMTCALKRAITFPRAKYLTLFDSTEEVDGLMVASKNSASLPEGNPCILQDGTSEVEKLVEPSLQKVFNMTQHGDGAAAESDGGNTCTHMCNTSNVKSIPLGETTFDATCTNMRETSIVESIPLGETNSDAEMLPQNQADAEMRPQKPRNLQKALSMKYIFNDMRIENAETCTPPHNDQLSMLQWQLCNEDYDVASLTYESDSSSCSSSSPELSSAASLKDWLPVSENSPPLILAADFYKADWLSSRDPPLILAADFYQAGNGTSMFDAFEASHTLLEPDILPSTKRVHLKYVGGDYDLPLDDATRYSPGVVTLGTDTSEMATKQLHIEGPCTSGINPQEELHNLAELWKDLTL